MHSDDGIVLTLPDTDAEPPTADLVVFDAEEIEAIVTAELGGSALFASRFRECAARSLLLPRRDPRQRTRAVAATPARPSVAAGRQRVQRLPGRSRGDARVPAGRLRRAGAARLMRESPNDRVRLVEVETPSASPFARSLLFGYVGMFLYEADAPLAERRAQALSLDPALLAELLGSTELRELLDGDAIDALELELQRLARAPRARARRSPRPTADFGRPHHGRGICARSDRDRSGRAGGHPPRHPGADRRRRALAGDRGCRAVARRASARRCRSACPRRSPNPSETRSADLVARFARTHGPFHSDEVSALGWGWASPSCRSRSIGCAAPVASSTGSSAPAGTAANGVTPRCCARSGAARWPRLRREVEPVSTLALARFAPMWQGIAVRSPARGTHWSDPGHRAVGRRPATGQHSRDRSSCPVGWRITPLACWISSPWPAMCSGAAPARRAATTAGSCSRRPTAPSWCCHRSPN